MVLAKAGRRLCRRFPARWQKRFVQDYFRHWCPDEELLTWTKGGFLMFASPRDYVSFRIYFFGEYDSTMTEFMRANIVEGATCLDIGAERGWFSLLMGQLVGAQGRVDTFEPFPVTFDTLVRNIELNGFSWVHPYRSAVGNKAGTVPFVPPSLVRTSNEAIRGNGIGHLSEMEVFGTIAVESVTLDMHTIDSDITRLDFMKIDVEGAEVMVLNGARDTIRRFRPRLAIEYNRRALRRFGSSIQELDSLLESFGYDRYTFGGSLRLFRAEHWTEELFPDDLVNVYCIPRR